MLFLVKKWWRNPKEYSRFDGDILTKGVRLFSLPLAPSSSLVPFRDPFQWNDDVYHEQFLVMTSFSYNCESDSTTWQRWLGMESVNTAWIEEFRSESMSEVTSTGSHSSLRLVSRNFKESLENEFELVKQFRFELSTFKTFDRNENNRNNFKSMIWPEMSFNIWYRTFYINCGQQERSFEAITTVLNKTRYNNTLLPILIARIHSIQYD